MPKQVIIPDIAKSPWSFNPVTGAISCSRGVVTTLCDPDPESKEYMSTGHMLAALPEFIDAAVRLRHIYLTGGDCDEAIEAMLLLNSAINKARL